MARYLFCFDESAAAWVPPRQLTPRAVFWAESRTEARERFEEALRVVWRGFGKAALRRESQREHARVADPCEVLPDLGQYLARIGGEDY